MVETKSDSPPADLVGAVACLNEERDSLLSMKAKKSLLYVLCCMNSSSAELRSGVTSGRHSDEDTHNRQKQLEVLWRIYSNSPRVQVVAHLVCTPYSS